MRKLFLIIFILFLFSPNFTSAAGVLKGDGRLILYSYPTGETIEVVYKKNSSYDKDAINKISKLMRSPDDKVIPISPKLIELIDDIQDHFGAETIEIISGYRSPEYNHGLRLEGRDVAKESLHKDGTAADIHIDEITEGAVRDYAASLGMGGVGFYPRYNFVHVDLGPVRSWGEEKAGERVLIGTDINPNKSWKAITDKNEYSMGDKITVEVTNVAYAMMNLIKNVWIERFRKGSWSEHDILEKTKKKNIVKPGGSVVYSFGLRNTPYGKYRIVIFTSEDFDIPPVVSNEFYVKRE